jgi:hypothetical protein
MTTPYGAQLAFVKIDAYRRRDHQRIMIASDIGRGPTDTKIDGIVRE